MTREENDSLTRLVVLRAQAALTEVLNEFRARYLDAHSHALLDEFDQRSKERLELIIPWPPAWKREADVR
jgi:hypothetical protein